MIAALSLSSFSALARDHGKDDRRGPKHDRYERYDRYDKHDRYRRGGPPPHAPAWGHRYQRGEYLPYQYRGRQYVVNDWRAYGLRQPPRGHHWVQYGSEFLLVAVATGVIASVILNGGY